MLHTVSLTIEHWSYAMWIGASQDLSHLLGLRKEILCRTFWVAPMP